MSTSLPVQIGLQSDSWSETALWRPVTSQDEPQLFALFAEEKAAQFTGTGLAKELVQPLIEMQYRGQKMTYASHYPNAEDSVLIANDGTPVGRLLLDRGMARVQNCWRIVDFAVLAEHRGKGLGTRVLKECQRLCKAAGARLELKVAPGNPASRLYERQGFHVVCEDAIAIEMVWIPAR